MEGTSARYSRGSLALLAHTFGINHAAVTTPILYQSTYLGSELGNLDNALLYGITMLTALFLAPLLNDALGARAGLFASMFGYTVYAVFFAVALLTPHHKDGTVIHPGGLMSFFGIAGSIIGGAAAGPLWTFQGVLVGKISQSIAVAEGKDSEEEQKSLNAELMATFAWWFLIWEAVMRAGTTALMKVLPAENWAPAATFLVFAALSGLSALAFLVGMPADARKAEASGSLCGKASKALALWRDPKLWLLQLTNLTFGFGAAWNASYVGPNFTSMALDAKYIGFTGALISLIGGFGSKLLGHLAQAIGKQAIILMGSLAFLAIGVLSKVLHDGSGMGWSVLIFPVLMGVGRAVYESTNKAVFLDFYPRPETHAGVFGNVMMFGTLSSTIVFILSSANVFVVVIYLLIAFAVCSYPAIVLAGRFQSWADSGKEVVPLSSA